MRTSPSFISSVWLRCREDTPELWIHPLALQRADILGFVVVGSLYRLCLLLVLLTMPKKYKDHSSLSSPTETGCGPGRVRGCSSGVQPHGGSEGVAVNRAPRRWWNTSRWFWSSPGGEFTAVQSLGRISKPRPILSQHPHCTRSWRNQQKCPCPPALDQGAFHCSAGPVPGRGLT